MLFYIYTLTNFFTNHAPWHIRQMCFYNLVIVATWTFLELFRDNHCYMNYSFIVTRMYVNVIKTRKFSEISLVCSTVAITSSRFRVSSSFISNSWCVFCLPLLIRFSQIFSNSLINFDAMVSKTIFSLVRSR